MIFDDIVYFSFLTKGRTGRIYIADGKVAMIEIDGDSGLTIAQAIDKFGEPNYVLNMPRPTAGFLGGDAVTNAIQIFNTSKGIEFDYLVKDVHKDWDKITPDIKVTGITFFDPNLYDKLLDVPWFAYPLFTKAKTLFYMKPWTGYGDIETKYPPANTDN